MKQTKIGIFSDTHGNLLALKAILKYFDEIKVDSIFHLGDVVCMGPRPKECMELLLSTKNLTCILGNHDNDYLNNNDIPPELSHVTKEHKRFMFDLMGEEYRKDVARFPLIVVQNYFGKKVAFMHYGLAREIDKQKNPKAVFRPIDNNTTAESLDSMFESVPADIVFFGHKHSAIDLVGKKVYCDVGSAGCYKDSFARCVVLTINEDGVYDIQRVLVPYDRQAVLKDMDDRQIPSAKFIQDFYFQCD